MPDTSIHVAINGILAVEVKSLRARLDRPHDASLGPIQSLSNINLSHPAAHSLDSLP